MRFLAGGTRFLLSIRPALLPDGKRGLRMAIPRIAHP